MTSGTGPCMLALAVTLATRFVGDFRHPVPTARRADLLARAERGAGRGP